MKVSELPMLWVAAGFMVGCLAGMLWGLIFRSIPFDVLVLSIFVLIGGFTGAVGGSLMWLISLVIESWAARFLMAAVLGGTLGFAVERLAAGYLYWLVTLTGAMCGLIVALIVRNYHPAGGG